FLSFFHSPTPEPRNPDDQGQVIAGYTLGSIIGYGSSSIIRRASSSSGTIAAVKIIRRADLVKAGNAPQVRKRLQHEAAVWASLSHEHILPLFSAVHTSYADYFFTLYCPAGSLFDILKRDGTPALPQDDAGMMFRQVVRGLRYLHEVARFVHRDMKLENVLVDEMGVCKIGDFGMSRKIGSPDDDDEDQEDQTELISNFMNPGNGMIHRAVSLAAPSPRRPAKSISLHASHIINRHNTTRHRNSTSANGPTHPFQPGSLPYAAPELLLPQTSDALRPHPSQDIWALGVMLYTLLTGRLPFYDTFEPRLQMKILNGTYTVPQGIGRGAERILQGCLERSLAQRWTIAMVDEIAWGVGWGAEGDDAAVIHEEPEE
ncbi:kinase-like domain-containing protein, partial [Flammula alnicola]